MYHHNIDELSIKSFIAELIDELRTGSITFFNKGLPVEELNSYLFYIVNAFAKKNARPAIKIKTQYLCPGCLFFKYKNILKESSQTYKCDLCEDKLKKSSDPKDIIFFRTYAKHNKFGYRCPDCERFIPHPLDNVLNISCSFFDCCFVGEWKDLNKMNHPLIKSNPEKLIPTSDMLIDDQVSTISQLEMKENLKIKINLLKEVIETQCNSVPYNSGDFTSKHKIFCYQAISNLLREHPIEMVDYLLNSSRSGGFQHKIFQEYIRLLEDSLPFFYKKNKKFYKINSLLDENLSIFDGISTFNAIVSDKKTIKNGTNEFYIGGRKAKITKPYYIGKLLNILNFKTKESLMDHVIGYSFSVIKLCDVLPGTSVTVTHLRVAPHYQMGGMVYVNRVRKKIIDKVHQNEK